MQAAEAGNRLLSSPPPFPEGDVSASTPNPCCPPPGDPPQWKEVEWVSEDVFSRWLSGTELPPLVLIHGGKVILGDGECVRLRNDLRDLPREPVLWKVMRVPRVALDAVTHASELWHFGRLHFAPGCGLHLWVRVHRLEDRLWTTLRLLGDVGLGGDRSAGHGLFRVKFQEETPPWPESDHRFVSLSPVYPPPEQVNSLLSNGCAYRLLTRTGWIGSVLPSPYRRKAVRLLAEGSILTGSSRKLWGALADVTPDGVPDLPHRVYRWGYAFPAGVR